MVSRAELFLFSIQVWEVDPLLCGNCGGEMKIISVIYERAMIKKILVHLKL